MTERLSTWLYERSTLENVLFGLLLIVCTVPIWCLAQFPTQDGPAHLYNAYLLSGWWKQSFPVDRTFFALNSAPVPNWFSTALLASLMQAFSPLTAEKVQLTSYVILLPLAFRYASRSFDHVSHYTYFLSFAFVWNHLFQLGFFNFCFSLVWYLFLLGYWARRRSRLELPQVVGLLTLSCLLYFSNGLSYYLAASTLGLLSVASFAMKPRNIPGAAWWKVVLRPQVGLLLAVPLSVWYYAVHGRYYDTRPSHTNLGSLSWSLTRVPILVSSYNAIDLKLSALFGLVLLIAIVVACHSRRRENRKFLLSDVLLAAAVGQFVLYVVAPQHTGGGGYINYRFMLFALVTLGLWIAVQPYNRATIAFVSGAATMFGLGLIARNLQRDLWLSAALSEYKEAAAHIEKHKSLLSLHFDRAGYGSIRDPGLRFDPFMHAAALLATERSLVDLDNYEAESKNFPIVYREGFDPMKVVENEGPSAAPPLADIAQYQRMTGRTVDYVLLWDVQRWDRTESFAETALKQLSSDYILIYCAENIPLRLYQQRRQVSAAYVAPNCPLVATGY